MVRVVPADTAGAKRAVLYYQTLHTNQDGSACCRVVLETGRSHQIRVQFASRGFPLLGDARYGKGGRQLCLLGLVAVPDSPYQTGAHGVYRPCAHTDRGKTMKRSPYGNRVLITGVTGGIGLAIADLFIQNGFRVAGCSRHKSETP